MKNLKSKGFTIIELLIVIFIIGILATVIYVSLTYMRQKARDAERISDINKIASVLESYYADNGNYPVDAFDEAGGYLFNYPESKNVYMTLLNNLTYITDYDYLNRDCPNDPFVEKQLSDPCSSTITDPKANPWGYRYTCWDAIPFDESTTPCVNYTLATSLELERDATLTQNTPSGNPEYRLFDGKPCYTTKECLPR